MALCLRILLIASISLSAFAESQKQVLARWSDWLAESASRLEAGDHKDALKLANRAIGEMTERLGPGDGSTSMLAKALAYKALAHAGLGEQDEALWYWQSAQCLYPKIAEEDFSRFGEPAAFLKQNTTMDPPAMTSASEGDIVTPVLRKRVKPKFPHGAHYFGVTGELIVQVVLTPDGRVRSPEIVQPLPAPTLSYVALEALRHWRFEPARVSGNPVPYPFMLTVEYRQQADD